MYTKKEKRLIRTVLTDLLSKCDGLLYKNPEVIGETNAVVLDETVREAIIDSYTNPAPVLMGKSNLNIVQ